MKKKYFTAIILIVCCLLSFSVSAANTASKTAHTDGQGTYSAEKVLETRFLNMLNHSFCYDGSFDVSEDIVNCSLIALLDRCEETEEGSFISEEYVRDYVYNMYGVEIENFSEINIGYPRKDGYVYVIPRGFTVYKHSIVSVTQDADGTYKVITDVAVFSHDGTAETVKAVTRFIANEKSPFGYNILSSDLVTDTANI